MANYSFADLDKWALATKQRMDAVVKGSVQRVVGIAQTPKAKGGNMPVDTGMLRNSLSSELHGSTSLKGPESYALVAANMEAGDIASFGWTAKYARRVNYGFIGTDSRGRNYSQPGAHFLEGAASQWQRIVKEEIAKAKAAAS